MGDNLSEGQIAEFKEAFTLFDRDNDANITCQELGMLMKSLGQPQNFRDLNQMVNEIDVDGNGVIDFSEFLNLMSKMFAITSNDDDLAEAFKVFDRDANGHIQGNELKQVMANLGEYMTAEEADEIVREADLDGDNAIDCDEFIKMMKH